MTTLHKRFEEITTEMTDLYKRKNADYGDSFTQSLDEFGVIAGVVRLSDKMNRIKALTKNDSQQVKDESIKDTLKDLANYAIMTLMWLEDAKIKDEVE
ncbi:nucleotide modification associated domain-containing protein [Eremococcus coleocola]|uniref:nucleotide modification associated domain-containing protein n=1 Tax=Eremococcus coleocola TaxID=88132 RepID=UPI000404C7D5|nr:nucleotide modification associated domain-containing protein [Eremococcus coleocola]